MAVKLISENLGTIGEALRKAGYSKSVSETPHNVTESKGYIEESAPIVAKLKRKRDAAINRMTDQKLDASTAAELARIIDTFTKNIELLSGRATERNEDNRLKDLTTDDLLKKLAAIRGGKNRGGVNTAGVSEEESAGVH